jgi:DNA polymerase
MTTNNELKEIVEELKNFMEFQQSMGVKTIPSQKIANQKSTPVISEKKELRTEPMAKTTIQSDQDIITIEEPEGLFDGKTMTLEEIREEIGDCTRCQLHEGRTNLVFGDGNTRRRQHQSKANVCR